MVSDEGYIVGWTIISHPNCNNFGQVGKDVLSRWSMTPLRFASSGHCSLIAHPALLVSDSRQQKSNQDAANSHPLYYLHLFQFMRHLKYRTVLVNLKPLIWFSVVVCDTTSLSTISRRVIICQYSAMISIGFSESTTFNMISITVCYTTSASITSRTIIICRFSSMISIVFSEYKTFNMTLSYGVLYH